MTAISACPYRLFISFPYFKGQLKLRKTCFWSCRYVNIGCCRSFGFSFELGWFGLRLWALVWLCTSLSGCGAYCTTGGAWYFVSFVFGYLLYW